MPRFRFFGAFFLAAWLVTSPNSAPVAAADAPAPIFRIFLKDGTALACWGEYSRVGDELVLTIPLGTGARRTYEFLTLPVASVDMKRTEEYAEAVRAAQFANAHGADEYQRLRDTLAGQLAAIPLLPDPKERVAAAESVRQQLLDWSNLSHGYKGQEVYQLLQLFDSSIIDLRVAAGESRFSINLSAGVLPPAPPKLRRDPGTAETVSLALKAAAATGDPEVRRAILKSARVTAARLPGEPGSLLRAAVAARIAAEAKTDAMYLWLKNDVVRIGKIAAAAGDVRAVDAQRRRLGVVDRRLGRKRPSTIAAAMAALDALYDAAAERRLALDRWEARRKPLADYRAQAAPLMRQLEQMTPMLRAIADLASTPLTELVRLQAQTADMVQAFSILRAPEGAADAHARLAQAIERADFAVRARHRAVAGGELSVAREAAAAAKAARVEITRSKAAFAALLTAPTAGVGLKGASPR